ncbi:MAG: DUF1385 domain-containing protein [Dehalococcoidales bacterium]|nr:DUF1385 domain-containing protein [Dehalococcoidales bacterium]
MAKKFYYGGQAVIEGVMMRGQKAMVTAVRRPGGGLALDTRLLGGIYSGWMRRTPLIRGVIVLIEVMVLGIKTLLYSANVSLEEEEAEISGWLVWLLVAVSLAVSVALFFMAPLFLTKLLDPYITSSLVFSLIEGFIRAALIILYLVVIGLVPDIKRYFAYHGAEHKAVNAYEAGVPLEVEAVRKYSTAHVRCGTSFLFTIIIIAIIVFAFVGLPSLWLMVLSRILLLPVIAAFGYEVIYFGGRHTDSALVRAILAPGRWLQRLTTREPDDTQLEVALSALRKVVELDQTEEAVQPSTSASVSS